MRNLIISVAFYSKFATLWFFLKTSNFLRETHLLFQKIPNSEGFRESYYLSRILRQVCYKLIKIILKHLINQRWLVYASSLGKHGVKTIIDLRRTFGCPYLEYGAKWSQWETWFLQAFVMKTSIRLLSSNEHEMNLNKRRRQPQSARLGVLVFLCRNFLDFWFLLPPSWRLFLAKFARYCKFLQDRAKKSKKIVGVLSRQAKITKIFAKEARESCIKVIQDHCSFGCILQQICYLQPFLMHQLFYRKTRLFAQNCSFFFELFEKSYYLYRILQQICYLYNFWKNHVFFKNPFFILKTRLLDVSKNPIIFVSFWTHLLNFSHF